MGLNQLKLLPPYPVETISLLSIIKLIRFVDSIVAFTMIMLRYQVYAVSRSQIKLHPLTKGRKYNNIPSKRFY